MTDPYAGRSDANADDQTIPLVPETGFAEVPQRPFAEETLLDPFSNEPWASGPGLGVAAPKPEPSRPAPPAPAAATGQTTSTPAPQTWGYPQPTAYSATPPPVPQPGPGAYPQPAPRATDRRPWADGYPEPIGPAATIPNPAYAPSPYAGQQWPAVPEPAREYGYGYGYGFDPATDHPNAVPALIMGIIGLVLFQPLAPVAWYLAAKGQREARLDPGRWRTGGLITAAKILGIIGTVLLGLVAAFVMFVIVMLAAFGP